MKKLIILTVLSGLLVVSSDVKCSSTISRTVINNLHSAASQLHSAANQLTELPNSSIDISTKKAIETAGNAIYMAHNNFIKSETIEHYYALQRAVRTRSPIILNHAHLLDR